MRWDDGRCVQHFIFGKMRNVLCIGLGAETGILLSDVLLLDSEPSVSLKGTIPAIL